MSYIGNTATQQAFTPAVDFFNGNGSTTAFTLSRPVASVAQVQVVISNVPQKPGDAYTVSGNTITFTSAPPSGTQNIYVYYTSPITQVIAPGQGTVTSDSFGVITNFTTTGNTTLGDATTDTLNVGNGGLIKDASGNVGVGTATPADRLDVRFATGSGVVRAGVVSGNNVKVYNTSGDISLSSSDASSDVLLDSQRNVILKAGNTSVATVKKDYSLALQGGTSSAGVGITFPATQSASSDANTLDDYEEGTFTPTLTFGGTTGSGTGISYSQQLGSYIKVGRMVYLNCRIGLSSKGSSTGNARLTGLPFNFVGGFSGNEMSLGVVWYNGWVNASNYAVNIRQDTTANSTFLEFRSYASGNELAVTDTWFNNNSAFNISIVVFAPS